MVNKQSFIKGTVILMCANAISKILGAVFKIPLTYLLREEGMALYSTAFSVYVMLLSFIISGMPLAISKMIAEEDALSHHTNVRKIVTVSSLLLGVLGILGTLVLWFGADFFALAMKEEKAVFCLKVIAPSIFFVAVGTVFKSFYQGKANMTPTAVSQVIEAVIKLLAGYGLALYYCRLSVEYTAAAAILGVTVGEIIATFILFVLYIPQRFSMPEGKASISVRKILDNILMIALPAIISSLISSAMNMADITLIRRCLEEIAFTKETCESFLLQYSSYTSLFDNLPEVLKISPEGSRWLYGAYSGYALTVFHLPVGILSSLGVSILPVIAGAIASKNQPLADNCAKISAKLTLLIALPASFVIFLFAEPVLELLFKNTASAQMLCFLAPCLVFLSMAQLFSVILNAGGKIISPFVYAFISAALKLFLNYILIRNPRLNMIGTVISANISYFALMLMTYLSVRKHFSLKCGIFTTFLKPLVCSLFMAGIMYLLYDPFTLIFKSSAVSLILCLSVGAVSYLLMLISTKTITTEDIALLKRKEDC